jgi:hypothetical protein
LFCAERLDFLRTDNGKYRLYLIVRIAIFNGITMRTKMISLFYKRTVLSVVFMVLLILSPRFALGQVSRSHTITVIVNPVTVMQISVGTINLDISGANAIAGQDEMSSLPDETSTLRWGTNSSLRKITIRTNLTPQQFSVKALAINSTVVGTVASQVTISTTDQNFLLNIARSSGSANIQYIGIALASQGIGTDSHLITLTIVAQ